MSGHGRAPKDTSILKLWLDKCGSLDPQLLEPKDVKVEVGKDNAGNVQYESLGTIWVPKENLSAKDAHAVLAVCYAEVDKSMRILALRQFATNLRNLYSSRQTSIRAKRAEFEADIERLVAETLQRLSLLGISLDEAQKQVLVTETRRSYMDSL